MKIQGTLRIALAALLGSALWAGQQDSFVIEHAAIHPVSGPEIPNGSVLVKDGKIEAVGTHVAAHGVRVVNGKGLHVYPGMIDSATLLGLSEISSIRETDDTNEIGDFNPQLTAEVAVNPASEHIPVTRANGITTAIALPSAGGSPGILTGQAALIHLDGWTWAGMNVLGDAAIGLQFPSLDPPRRSFLAPPGGATTPFRELQRAYDERLRKLKDFFENARRYQTAKQGHAAGFETDLKFEAMIPVLEKKVPLLVLAPREPQMRAALAFAKAENVRMVLAGCREIGKLGADIKAANVPVILGPTLETPIEEDMPYDQAYALPAAFFRAGVKIAFGTFDVQFARNLPYEASMASAFGLPKDEALKSVTLNAAEIWGVADKLGSIEPGKLADLIVTDGDPLETRTQVLQVFIAGKSVDLDNRQKRLYEKYMKRP